MDHRWDTVCGKYNFLCFIMQLTLHSTVRLLSFMLIILTFCGALGAIDKTNIILHDCTTTI